MSDNTTLPVGAGGDTVRTIDKAGNKVQTVVIDLGGSGAESLLTGTLPVSVASLPRPTNAATDTNQALEVISLANIDSKMPALGQALAAASTPVVLTAAQLTTLTPPAAIAGFALEAGHLAAIDTSTAKIPSQGQALAAASMPVVLTAAQVTTLTPPAAITGYALEAGHLAAIDTSTAKIPALGQALAAASVPVVLTAAQLATLTPIAGSLEATQLLVKAKTDNLDVALSTRALESGGNLATIAAKDFATQTTLAALLALLNIAQGAVGTSLAGPMVQGVVDDTANVYLPTEIRPLSISTEGRLRVITTQAPTYLEFFDTGGLMEAQTLTSMADPWKLKDSPWSL